MLLLISASMSFAQSAPAPAPAEPAPAPSDVTVVEGELLKPEITVIIARENLNKAYELKLDESFLDKILGSVQQPPF
jgi:hypothetical protein